MILDSHCHAWDVWPYARVPDAKTRGSVELLLHELDVHEVERALVVCAAIGHNPENIAYVAKARDRHPDRLLLIADLDCVWSATYHVPGSTERLRELDARYDLAGFAHYTADTNDGWLAGVEADAVFALAAEHRWIVSLGITPAWHEDLRALARRHPSVPVLCQTLGGLHTERDLDSPGVRAVLASAEVPNIYIKVAGLHYCTAHGWDYPWPGPLAVLEHIHDHFGAGRLCWGSDFPASTRFTTFQQSLEVVRDHCPFFTAADRRLVLGETLNGLLAR